MSTLTTSTRSGSNPSGTFESRANERTKSAAAMTSASDSAIWTITRPLERVKKRRQPLRRVCPCPHLEHVHGAPRVARSAGTVPKMPAVDDCDGCRERQDPPVERQIQHDAIDRCRQLRHECRLPHAPTTRPPIAPSAARTEALDQQLSRQAGRGAPGRAAR